MKVLSTHCTLNLSDKQLATGDFTEALKWWDECIAAHKAAGVEYIVVPSMRRIETLDGLATYCRYFNEVGARCKAAGTQVRLPQPLARVREGRGPRDARLHAREHRSRQGAASRMDVYWAVMGQASPVDYFTKYPGRFRLLHIKDRREVGQSGMVGLRRHLPPTPRPPASRTSSSRSRDRATATSLRSVRECVDYLHEAPLRRGFLCEIVRPCGRIGTIRLSQDNRIVRRMETRSAVRAAGFRCWENARRRVSPTGGDDGRLRYRLIDKL